MREKLRHSFRTGTNIGNISLFLVQNVNEVMFLCSNTKKKKRKKLFRNTESAKFSIQKPISKIALETGIRIVLLLFRRAPKSAFFFLPGKILSIDIS